MARRPARLRHSLLEWSGSDRSAGMAATSPPQLSFSRALSVSHDQVRRPIVTPASSKTAKSTKKPIQIAF